MPCPHFKITITQRSRKQSAVAGAAYQSGESLFSEYDQKVKSYSEKRGIVYTEIMLPANAPPEYADRNILWNAAEAVEKQWNSQLARRIVLALPREVPMEQYPQMLRDFCEKFFVSKGMCADFAIHDKGDGNPHAHIMLTMRAMDEHGKWLPKSRKVYDLDEKGERIRLPSGNWKSHKEDTVDWNEQKYAEIWRHGWEEITNQYLEAADRPERVDLRSFERQGIDLAPTVHMGPAVTQMERRGVPTIVGNLNRDIKETNRKMLSIRNVIRGLENWLKDLTEKHNSLEDEEQAEASPSLAKLLMNYLDMRKEGRSDWSAAANRKSSVDDLKKIADAIAYLKENDMVTLEDLDDRLQTQKEKSASIAKQMKSKEKRMSTINKVTNAMQTITDLKSVHDQYIGIRWNSRKEKFAREHPELERYDKAFRLLKAHPAEEKAGRKALTEECKNLKSEYDAMLEDLKPIQDELQQLNNVRYYIGQVLPKKIEELTKETESKAASTEKTADGQERRSVLGRLQEKQAQIDAQKNQKQQQRSNRRSSNIDL